MANTRRTPTQWQQILQEQTQSGLSVHEYCDQNSIATSSFFKWRCILKIDLENTSDVSTEDDKWVPIENAIPTANVWDLELSLPNGIVLRMKHA
ncbi:MAG: hypothetical protein HRT37_17195 [Alteromonadaceae bacterium]|nr:hypothetical protein [Alteromonadaceae bacterium]